VSEGRARVTAWLGRQVLPHEGDLRAWLRQSFAAAGDVDDIIQETYCRLAALTQVDHIEHPRAYFFQAARSVALEQIRRARVVRIETVSEMDTLNLILDDPSAERVVSGRRELQRVRGLIADLPERCRRIFEMRKIDGVSQREIARRLGVTEHVVENEAVRGLRAILAAMTEQDAPTGVKRPRAKSDGRTRKRR
jgi:RNA polymerase sigma factor (sigma-70 family)